MCNICTCKNEYHRSINYGQVFSKARVEHKLLKQLRYFQTRRLETGVLVLYKNSRALASLLRASPGQPTLVQLRIHLLRLHLIVLLLVMCVTNQMHQTMRDHSLSYHAPQQQLHAHISVPTADVLAASH